MTTRHHTAPAAAAVIICATMGLTACSSSSSGGTHTTSAPAPTQTTGGPTDPNWARGVAAVNAFLALPPAKTLPAAASKYATSTMVSNTNLTNTQLWETAKGGPIVRGTGTGKVTAWKPVTLNLAGPAAPAGDPWHMTFRACVVSTGGLYNKAGKLVASSPAGGLVASVSAVSADSGSHWKVSNLNYADKTKAPGGDPKCGSTGKTSSKSSTKKAEHKK